MTETNNAQAELQIGLPIDHMRDAAELRASLIRKHHIKTGTAELIANVTEVLVMPQS